MKERAYAPHCDSSILHEPGSCVYCDRYPELQEYRTVSRIAFSGSADELGNKETKIAPCPSTYFRTPEIRDRWYGNVAK